MRSKSFALALLGGVVLAAPAQAAFFTDTDGLDAPASTLTFSEVDLPDDTLVTNQFAAFGVTFNNAVINPQDGFLPRDYAGNFFFEEVETVQFDDLQITFGSPTTAAAFELVTNTVNSTINIFLGATLIDSATFATGPGAGQFYGFTGSAFDRIQILTPDRALLIDNIQRGTAVAGPVPEPATWAMMLVGFGFAGGAMRYRRCKTSVAFA